MQRFYIMILILALCQSCIDRNKESYLKICQPATNLTPKDITKIGFKKVSGADVKMYGYKTNSKAVTFTVSDDFEKITSQKWHILFDTLTEDNISTFFTENDILIRGKETQPTVLINDNSPRVVENWYIIERNKQFFLSKIDKELNQIVIFYDFPTKM